MPCCLQNMEITTSSFTIGQIKQKCHCYPVFQVCDSNENATLEIKGPVCPISCFGNVDFEVILDISEARPLESFRLPLTNFFIHVESEKLRFLQMMEQKLEE